MDKWTAIAAILALSGGALWVLGGIAHSMVPSIIWPGIVGVCVAVLGFLMLIVSAVADIIRLVWIP